MEQWYAQMHCTCVTGQKFLQKKNLGFHSQHIDSENIFFSCNCLPCLPLLVTVDNCRFYKRIRESVWVSIQVHIQGIWLTTWWMVIQKKTMSSILGKKSRMHFTRDWCLRFFFRVINCLTEPARSSGVLSVPQTPVLKCAWEESVTITQICGSHLSLCQFFNWESSLNFVR